MSCWDTKRGQQALTHPSVVGTCAALHIANDPADPVLIAGGRDGKLAAWRHPADPERSYLVTAFDALQPSLQSPAAPLHKGEHRQSFLEYSPADGCAYAAGQRAEQETPLVTIWDLEKEQSTSTVPVSGGPISCLSNPAGALAVCGLAHGELVSLDTRTPARVVQRSKPHAARPLGACMSPGGRSSYLATADASGDVMLFDLRAGSDPIVHTGPCKQGARSFACHPEASVMALGSQERRLRLFSLDGTLSSRVKVPAVGGLLPAKDAPVVALRFHPARPMLAAGASDCSVSFVR